MAESLTDFTVKEPIQTGFGPFLCSKIPQWGILEDRGNECAFSKLEAAEAFHSICKLSKSIFAFSTA